MAESNQLNPLLLWFKNHSRAFVYSFGELCRTPFASLMTLLVIGIAMALPAGFYVVLQNFQTLSHEWNGSPTISLYLKKDLPQPEVDLVVNELKQNANFADIQYISPAEGLAQFAKQIQFSNVLKGIQSNPLPGVIIATPTQDNQAPAKIQALLKQLQNLAQVNQARLDLAWVKRLYYIITISERITIALAILFCIGVVLIIGNTIRLSAESYQTETAVLRLIGATNAFIRRPLIYRGFLYGFLGGSIAWGLVATVLWTLETPAQNLAATYENGFVLHGLTLPAGLAIVLICTLLGTLGASITAYKQLRKPEIA